MKPTFLSYEKPLLTVMIKQTQNPDNIIAEIKRAHAVEAEAFGIQTEALPREYHTEKIFKEIFAECGDKPLYVTNYKLSKNENLSYDEIGDELVSYAKWGATLCDVMGDMYCKSADELTYNDQAIEKQMRLIDRIHECGGEVVMSSHTNRFMTADEVLKMALEHRSRGADISKIVAHADNMEQQIENLRITNILKEELGIPFLFLSGGECRIHRKIGIKLGCCMCLCVCELPEGSTNPQPLITGERILRDDLQF